LVGQIVVDKTHQRPVFLHEWRVALLKRFRAADGRQGKTPRRFLSGSEPQGLLEFGLDAAGHDNALAVRTWDAQIGAVVQFVDALNPAQIDQIASMHTQEFAGIEPGF
jgi:hypothetical protein